MQPVTSRTDSKLADWITANAGLHDVEIGDLLAGGNANVTRLVTAREGRFVLRHPPVNALSDKAAAGISREYTAISALYGEAPVARPMIYCDDSSILGQCFSITEFVEGVPITDTLPANYGPDGVKRLGLSLMETLGAVHQVDPSALQAKGFGKPQGFAKRQVHRWLETRRRSAVRDLPLLDEIGAWLLGSLPTEQPPAIIHCDFHLDNCLAARDVPEVRAVIDWEMATLGDPLVDLGLCLFFWKRETEKPMGFGFVQAVSNSPDAPDRHELADAWSQATGRDHLDLPWFMVFSAWRLAAIVEGAWKLHVEGVVSSEYARGLEQDVPNLLEEAAALIEGPCR